MKVKVKVNRVGAVECGRGRGRGYPWLDDPLSADTDPDNNSGEDPAADGEATGLSEPLANCELGCDADAELPELARLARGIVDDDHWTCPAEELCAIGCLEGDGFVVGDDSDASEGRSMIESGNGKTVRWLMGPPSRLTATRAA